jgi:hypothetical protein
MTAEVIIQDTGDLTHIVVQGDLVVRNISNLKSRLSQILSDYSSIKIVVKNVERMDVAFIQLLLAIKKSKGERAHLEFEESEYLSNWFALSGLKKESF